MTCDGGENIMCHRTGRLLLWPGKAGDNRGPDPTAWIEDAPHLGPHRLAGFRYVVQNAVDDVLLEDPEIAIRKKIFLERLQFEATLVRHVANPELAEIGQSGLRADRGELRHIDFDLIARKLVRPHFNIGEVGVQPRGSVFRGIGGFFRHSAILNARH